jgi:hypothetical protein
MTRRQEAKDGGERYRVIAAKAYGFDLDMLRAAPDKMLKKEVRKWNR